MSGQDGLTTHPASPSGRNLDRGPGGVSRGCRCRRRRWSGARHRDTGLPADLTVETGSRLRQGSIYLDLNARTAAMNRFMFYCGVSPGSRCTLMPGSAGPGSFRSAASSTESRANAGGLRYACPRRHVAETATQAQQFQIWVAAANSVPTARLMVDALRLSTLRNRLRCRVDKARHSVSGTRHGGRARRIHQGSRDASQIWNCWTQAPAPRRCWSHD